MFAALPVAVALWWMIMYLHFVGHRRDDPGADSVSPVIISPEAQSSGMQMRRRTFMESGIYIRRVKMRQLKSVSAHGYRQRKEKIQCSMFNVQRSMFKYTKRINEP